MSSLKEVMNLLRQFVLPRFLARVLTVLAYRKTAIPHATAGHKHRFFSFYLTQKLNLRTTSGETLEARDKRNFILWIVPPGMFHEWVASAAKGAVWDITPLHRRHQLVV